MLRFLPILFRIYIANIFPNIDSNFPIFSIFIIPKYVIYIPIYIYNITFNFTRNLD